MFKRIGWCVLESEVADLARTAGLLLYPPKFHTQMLEDGLSQMSLLPIENSGSFVSLSEIRYQTSRIRSFSTEGDIEEMKLHLETQF